MKQIIIIFLILLGILSCETKGGNAQQDAAYTPATTEDTSSVQDDTLSVAEVSLSQLQGTKWEQVVPLNKKFRSIHSYSKTKETTEFVFEQKNTRTSLEYTYYLSPVEVRVFDHSKVGTNTSGCFLITYNLKTKIVSSCKIIKFDKEKGIMTWCMHGGLNKNMTIDFYMIK